MESVSIYILFIVAMFCLLFFVKKSGYIEKRINRLYLCAISVNIISFICYIGRGISQKYHLRFLAYVVNTILYIAGPTITFLLILCCCKKGEFIYKFVVCIQILNMLLSITTPFTGFYYTISEQTIYSRGQFSKFSFVIAAIFGTLWIIRMIIKYKNIQMEDKIYIILFAILSVFIIVLQVFDSRYKLEYFGASFVLMLYYVFMIESDGKYDKMTKAFSRRYYFTVITRTLNKADEYAVMFFDANGLKNINDNFGHDAGDFLIKSVAKSIKNEIKDNGKLFRLGGDEFLAIIDCTDEAELNEMAKRINVDLADKSKNSEFEISTSVGIAVHDKNELHEDTEKRADIKMYSNKDEYYKKTRKTRRV